MRVSGPGSRGWPAQQAADALAQWHFLPAQASEPETWRRGDGCMVKQGFADGASCVQLSTGEFVLEKHAPWWRKRRVAYWQDAISAKHWLDREYPAPFQAALPKPDHREDAPSRRAPGRGDLQAQLTHIFRFMPPAVAIVAGSNPARRGRNGAALVHCDLKP